MPAKSGDSAWLVGVWVGPSVLGPAWRPGAGRAWTCAGTAPSLTEEEEEEDPYRAGLLLGCRRDSRGIWVSAEEGCTRWGRR